MEKIIKKVKEIRNTFIITDIVEDLLSDVISYANSELVVQSGWTPDVAEEVDENLLLVVKQVEDFSLGKAIIFKNMIEGARPDGLKLDYQKGRFQMYAYWRFERFGRRIVGYWL